MEARPSIEDVRLSVVRPPPVPPDMSPETVEVSWLVEIYPMVARPIIDEVSSVGVRPPPVPPARIPETVEKSWLEEMYPAEPRPAVVLWRLVE